MQKQISYFLYISIFLIGFSSLNTYALAWQYDLICTGIKSSALNKSCSDKVIWVSKCKSDPFREKICKAWWSPDVSGVYPVHDVELYSDVDTRISIPTENYKKKILRYMEEDEVIEYAWEKWKDLDFILMIQEESLWQEFILWDNGTSVGYCQISKIHWKELYDTYMNAKDWKERITICHNHYLKFAYNVGVVFHGWKSRMRNLPSFTFK